MKTFGKFLLVVGLIAVFGFIVIFISVSYLHAKSHRQISQLVSEIQPGASFLSVSSRLGRVSQILTNTVDIQTWGTTKEDCIVTNSTLHMFVHDAIPFRWICIYTDRDAQTIIYASWRDM